MPRLPLLPAVSRTALAKAQAQQAWGRRVTRPVCFGPRARFAVYAIANRFGGVSWIIQDAETEGHYGLPLVVGQSDDRKAIRARMADLLQWADDDEEEEAE